MDRLRLCKYQLKLLAFLILISTGVTAIVASYVPEEDLKTLYRKAGKRSSKRSRVRRWDGAEIEEED